MAYHPLTLRTVPGKLQSFFIHNICQNHWVGRWLEFSACRVILFEMTFLLFSQRNISCLERIPQCYVWPKFTCLDLRKNVTLSWALVGHVYNPSYSGGKDQKFRGSKPAWANSSARPYLEKPFAKIGLVQWLKVKALSSSPSTAKKRM
jgi:hypothetical protein